MRCLTLAGRLAASGWSCAFAVNPEAGRIVPGLMSSGFEVTAHAGGLFEDMPGGADLLVMDDYGMGEDFESSCRGRAARILVIDDLADRKHHCDMLLDATPGRSAESYQGLVPEGCRLLLGPEYALLRDEFSAIRAEALKRRERSAGVERVLVSFGLADPAGATAKAVQGVLESGVEARIEVLLGREAKGYDDVAGLASKSRLINLSDFAGDMAALMTAADLALGGAGTTSWERCCLGLPAIVLSVAQNQEMNARTLEAEGAAVDLGPAGGVEVSDIARSVEHIANKGSARRAMSRAAARLCDGLGAMRAALALHPPARAGDGGLVGMRPAHAGDKDAMFEWQTHPGTRRFARNPGPPGRDEHEEWFDAKRNDPDCDLLVILHEGREAGVFRLDRLESGAKEVSIVVAPEFRGRGIGAAALSFAGGFWPYEELHAEILAGNEISRRLFLSAGYEHAGGTMYVRKAGVREGRPVA